MSRPIIIEEHHPDRVDWIVSFDGSNPTEDHLVICANQGEAEKLLRLIDAEVLRAFGVVMGANSA